MQRNANARATGTVRLEARGGGSWYAKGRFPDGRQFIRSSVRRGRRARKAAARTRTSRAARRSRSFAAS